jgi:prolyl 4-hydroxylase
MRTLLDGALFQEIQQFYRGHGAVPEDISNNPYITTTKRCAKKGIVPVLLTELPDMLKTTIHTALQPIAEAWVKRELIPTYVYGVRTYQRGAMLALHRDREGTHIVSAILNVDQRVDAPWPLLLRSEEGEPSPWREIYLTPGELAFYEGNRLTHGRPSPLLGESYSNVFIHFKLA